MKGHIRSNRIVQNPQQSNIPPLRNSKSQSREAKPRKTQGHDPIANSVLKHLTWKAVALLKNIINAMLRVRHGEMEEENIIMRLKEGKEETFP